MPKDRMHSEFVKYKTYQINNAQIILENLCERCSDESFGEINNIFAYSFPEYFESKLDNPEIQQKMILENEKSQEIMNYLLDPVQYRK